MPRSKSANKLNIVGLYDHLQVSPGARKLMAVIGRETPQGSPKCPFTMKELAVELGVSIRSVREWRRELFETGRIDLQYGVRRDKRVVQIIIRYGWRLKDLATFAYNMGNKALLVDTKAEYRTE